MIKSDTIKKFHLYIDDTSELSSTEEEELYDKIVQKVSMARPWQKTKVEYSGTTDGTTTLALPTQFAFMVQNANYTDQSYDAERPVVFVGPNYDEYQVVSWDDRRQYRGQTNICWVDIVNSTLVFATAPSSGLAVEYDYHAIPADIATSASPWIPAAYDHIIYHGMCVDSFVIQQSEKAKSYQSDNQRMYNNYMEDLSYWNAELQELS